MHPSTNLKKTAWFQHGFFIIFMTFSASIFASILSSIFDGKQLPKWLFSSHVGINFLHFFGIEFWMGFGMPFFRFLIENGSPVGSHSAARGGKERSKKASRNQSSTFYRFWSHFWLILEPFWIDLGAILERFGAIWERFWEQFRKALGIMFLHLLTVI